MRPGRINEVAFLRQRGLTFLWIWSISVFTLRDSAQWLRVSFEQLLFYQRRPKLPIFGKRKDQDEESSGKEEEEDLEEDSANEADEKDEGELPIQGANGDKDEDDSDEDEAEIWKVANCLSHASQS